VNEGKPAKTTPDNERRRTQTLLLAAVVLLAALLAALVAATAFATAQNRVLLVIVFALAGGLGGWGLVYTLGYIARLIRQAQGPPPIMVPQGQVFVLYRHGRRIGISHGPQVRVNPDAGESYQAIDTREQHSELPLQCKTADRKDIKATMMVVYRVANLETYLDRAAKPNDMMQQVLRAAMTTVVGRYDFKQLSARLEALPYEVASNARAYLAGYGIALIALMFTSMDLGPASGKSPAEVEADHLLKIGQAAKEAGERALEHIEKMAQATANKGG
jgi:hypothetical protein